MATLQQLPLFYFGPAKWFRALREARQVEFVVAERFPKRTYRHKCIILGANGPILLSVHLRKWHSGKSLTNDIEVSYTEHWQKDHWQSIRSAYGRSPYFEHYAARFEHLFQQQPNSLVEWNLLALQTVIDILNLQLDFSVSDSAEPPAHDFEDPFKAVQPKLENLTAHPDSTQPYLQTFADRYGFVPNLSILDLIFNEGPNAVTFL